jgi:hypothetical protein
LWRSTSVRIVEAIHLAVRSLDMAGRRLSTQYAGHSRHACVTFGRETLRPFLSSHRVHHSVGDSIRDLTCPRLSPSGALHSRHPGHFPCRPLSAPRVCAATKRDHPLFNLDVAIGRLLRQQSVGKLCISSPNHSCRHSHSYS